LFRAKAQRSKGAKEEGRRKKEEGRNTFMMLWGLDHFLVVGPNFVFLVSQSSPQIEKTLYADIYMVLYSF
jgi:hypothetical protein